MNVPLDIKPDSLVLQVVKDVLTEAASSFHASGPLLSRQRLALGRYRPRRSIAKSFFVLLMEFCKKLGKSRSSGMTNWTDLFHLASRKILNPILAYRRQQIH